MLKYDNIAPNDILSSQYFHPLLGLCLRTRFFQLAQHHQPTEHVPEQSSEQLRALLKARIAVHLDEPQLVARIYEKVVAEQLEGLGSVARGESLLHAAHALEHYLLHCLEKGGEGERALGVLLLEVLHGVFDGELVAFAEVAVVLGVLLHCIVGQVYELVVDIGLLLALWTGPVLAPLLRLPLLALPLLREAVLDTGQPRIAVPVEMRLEHLLAVGLEHVEHHPHPHVELVAVDEQRALNVLLDYVALGTHVVVVHFEADFEGVFAEQLGELLETGKQVDATAAVQRGRLEDPKGCLLLVLWFFFGFLGSKTLVLRLGLFQQFIDLFVGDDYFHEVVLDGDGSALGLFGLLCEIVPDELQQALLNLALLLLEINDERRGNVVTDRFRVAFLHVLVQSLLIGQLALPLEVVVDHVGGFSPRLAYLRQVILVQAFGAVEACGLLAAGLQPADLRVLPHLRLREVEPPEDLLQNSVVVALGKVDQFLAVLWLFPALLDVQLGLHHLCLFVAEKYCELVLLALLPHRTDAESPHFFLTILLGLVLGFAFLDVFLRPCLAAFRFVGTPEESALVLGSIGQLIELAIGRWVAVLEGRHADEHELLVRSAPVAVGAEPARLLAVDPAFGLGIH